MSYHFSEIKDGRRFSELTESEQKYINQEWERLCNRKAINTSEVVFFQKANGRFFKATRGRLAAHPSHGSAGGYWAVVYGNCKAWRFCKNPFGEFDPEPAEKRFGSLTKQDGEIVPVPHTVHTKSEALELAKKLGFEF